MDGFCHLLREADACSSAVAQIEAKASLFIMPSQTNVESFRSSTSIHRRIKFDPDCWNSGDSAKPDVPSAPAWAFQAALMNDFGVSGMQSVGPANCVTGE